MQSSKLYELFMLVLMCALSLISALVGLIQTVPLVALFGRELAMIIGIVWAVLSGVSGFAVYFALHLELSKTEKYRLITCFMQMHLYIFLSMFAVLSPA